MLDSAERAARTEAMRVIADKVMTLWPSESRPEEAMDNPDLTAAMAEFNAAVQDGQGGTLARLLTENVAYRLLVDQGIEVLPECDMTFNFASSAAPYFVSQALGWVASCARQQTDYLFAAMMTAFNSEHLVASVTALFDAGSALRDGKAMVIITPPDPTEADAEMRVEVTVRSVEDVAPDAGE